MKKWHYLFLAFLAIGTVIILSESKQGKPEYRTAQGLVFGTRYNITYLYNADLQPDIDYTLALVDSALSMFNPQSTISAVNSSESIQVTDTMFLKVTNRPGCFQQIGEIYLSGIGFAILRFHTGLQICNQL